MSLSHEAGTPVVSRAFLAERLTVTWQLVHLDSHTDKSCIFKNKASTFEILELILEFNSSKEVRINAPSILSKVIV